jgi:hypothetical protein
VRPLRTVLAVAVAVCALPAALGAQETPISAPIQPARPAYIRPPYTPKPAKPGKPSKPNAGMHRYPILIDGSIVNRYLATPGPTPKPAPTHKPTPRPANAPDQFGTHTNDGG